MYEDEFNYREGDDSLIGIVFGFILLIILLVIVGTLLISLPFLVIDYLDAILLDSMIPWYLEFFISFTSTLYGLTWFTDTPKNPIDWYIIFYRSTVSASESADSMEVLEWVETNIPGKWYQVGSKSYRFLKNRDAMAFKLRWF